MSHTVQSFGHVLRDSLHFSMIEEQEAIFISKLHVAVSAMHVLNSVCFVLVAQNKECVR